MTRAQGTNTPGRWWEYYTLRYFVGTVVGAVVTVWLAKEFMSPLRDLGFPLVDDTGGLGVLGVKITALGALGFAYCYIAGAPVLVLHAMRAQLRPSRVCDRWVFWVVSAVLVIAADGSVIWWRSIAWWSCRSLGVLVFSAIVGSQVAVIVDACWDRFKTIRSFYCDLAEARGRENPTVDEYVESYRHLREHGNAYAILALEFALAFALVSVRSPRFAVAAVVLWLLPSTCSWLVGSALETGGRWRGSEP